MTEEEKDTKQIVIDKDLHAAFKSHCALEGVHMRYVVEDLIKAFMAKEEK